MTGVAIVGSGAIGLLYGGWLQSAGLDIVFVTRPGWQAAITGRNSSNSPSSRSAKLQAWAEPKALRSPAMPKRRP
ncbi:MULTISPECIES: 2-dehydropantoate 2-reductase N-terminal domain-containing protein [unclassified Bradyrhizobium]